MYIFGNALYTTKSLDLLWLLYLRQVFYQVNCSPSCIDPFTKKKEKKKNSNNRLQSLIIHIQTHMTGQRPKQTGLSES